MDIQKRKQQSRAATRLATHVRDNWYRRREELARLCSEVGQPCTGTYLHQVASGRRKARPGLAKAIVDVSGGALTEQDGADYCYLQ